MDSNNKLFNSVNIIAYLEESLNKSQEICKVCFISNNKNFWSFYVKEGALVWATENEHPLKILHTVINKICPEIDSRGINLRETEHSELWEYLAIKVLYQRQKINLKQAVLIIQEYITEIFFDCCQNSHNINNVELIYAKSHNFEGAILRHPLLKEPIAEIDFSLVCSKGLKSWEDWQNAGLEKYSPNLALVIKDQDQLKQSTEEARYQKLTLLINGSRTIRDLSILTKKEPLALMNALIPYINHDLMELKAIPDEKIPNQNSSTKDKQSKSVFKQAQISETNSKRYSNQPLIICIDDSPAVNAQMKKILEQENYRVIVIEEVHLALTTMLENKPDMIFLDLVMPVVNGYEICSQIRRVSSLQDVPIVILTGNDGLFDRVRAKMIGASDFINKPIEADKIVAIVRKYLKRYQDSSQNNLQLINQKA